MSTLPTEIFTEILSFLPPKSLCRFKSVAKSWHILITSDAFIKLHLAKTLISQPSNLIICDDSLSSAAIFAENPNELSFSAVDHPVKHFSEFAAVHFIGSCRGILCIADKFKKTVFYFNPSTKSHRLIPPAPTEIPASEYLALFIKKPIKHVVNFGFGYDSSVDDYKLLRITELYVDRVQICREVRLYSMRSNSWKNVKDNLDSYCNQPVNAVHINGVLYFVVADDNHFPRFQCFDLKTEEFSEEFSVIDMFECGKSFSMFLMVELGGCFAVMENYLNTDGSELACAELWVRKEVSWVRLFRVSGPFKIGSLTCFRPVVYSKDGQRVLLEVDGSKFYWFDWRSNEFTRVEACGILSKDSRFVTYAFVPSLVSLRSDEDVANDEPKKNVNKKNLDGFLSTGFKLRL